MNHIVFILAALTLVSGTPVMAQQQQNPQPPPPSMMATTTPTKAQQELLDLSRAKWRWMADKRVDSLATLFADSAIFVHMGGAWGRTPELETIRSGGIHYKHAEVYESWANVTGTTGIMLSRIRLDAVVGGNEVTTPFLVTEVYVRENKRWKLASLSFTRLLTAPPGS